jgi:hypothetical protein
MLFFGKILFGLETAENGSIKKFMLKRIATAQKNGRSTPTGRGPGPASRASSASSGEPAMRRSRSRQDRHSGSGCESRRQGASQAPKPGWPRKAPVLVLNKIASTDRLQAYPPNSAAAKFAKLI